MAKSVLVTVPHALTKVEAQRRIEQGLEQVRQTLPSVVKFEDVKSEDGLITLSARALAQSLTATITVQDRQVILEASVPLMLAAFTAAATNASQQWISRLLWRVPPQQKLS